MKYLKTFEEIDNKKLKIGDIVVALENHRIISNYWIMANHIYKVVDVKNGKKIDITDVYKDEEGRSGYIYRDEPIQNLMLIKEWKKLYKKKHENIDKILNAFVNLIKRIPQYEINVDKGQYNLRKKVRRDGFIEKMISILNQKQNSIMVKEAYSDIDWCDVMVDFYRPADSRYDVDLIIVKIQNELKKYDVNGILHINRNDIEDVVNIITNISTEEIELELYTKKYNI